MEAFIAQIDEYGLLVVAVGFIACVLCGCIKLPIVKIIKSKGLGEKATSNRINTVCTLIVTIFSILLIAGYYCIKAHSLQPLKLGETYSQILLAISFSKIAYMLYEGIGKVSVKSWMHALFEKIKSRVKTEKVSSVEEYYDVVESVLKDTLHLPLTDGQSEILKDRLEHTKFENKENS